jgi:hypothetical protein
MKLLNRSFTHEGRASQVFFTTETGMYVGRCCRLAVSSEVFGSKSSTQLKKEEFSDRL